MQNLVLSVPQLPGATNAYPQNQQIRVISLHGVTWYSFLDVCVVLQLPLHDDRFRVLPEQSKAIYSRSQILAFCSYTEEAHRFWPGARGNITHRFIDQSGIYELLFSAKEPLRTAFRDWLLAHLHKPATSEAPSTFAAFESKMISLSLMQEKHFECFTTAVQRFTDLVTMFSVDLRTRVEALEDYVTGSKTASTAPSAPNQQAEKPVEQEVAEAKTSDSKESMKQLLACKNRIVPLLYRPPIRGGHHRGAWLRIYDEYQKESGVNVLMEVVAYKRRIKGIVSMLEWVERFGHTDAVLASALSLEETLKGQSQCK